MTRSLSRALFTSLCLFVLQGLEPRSLLMAADWEEWPFEHPVVVARPGLVRLTLPGEAFSASRPDLGDLRILNPQGNETPFVVERPEPPSRSLRRMERPAITLEGQTSVLVLPLQQPGALRSVQFETPASQFMKAVSLELVLQDGTRRPVIVRRAIYRLNGAESLTIPIEALDPQIRALRITLDDSRSRPIPISSLALVEESTPRVSAIRKTARILDRVESRSGTRITLDLGGAGLPIIGVEIDVEDPLFIRKLKLLQRGWHQGELQDEVLASGLLHRIDVGQPNPASQLEMDSPRFLAKSELILSLENGDSPPLKIRSVRILSEPTTLAFLGQEVGTYRLLSGAAEVPAPRYDITALKTELRSVRSQEVVAGGLVVRSNYRPRSQLAEVESLGAIFDPAGWKFRQPIAVKSLGVQRLDLPLHVLAQTRADHGDLRVVSENKQVLYLLDDPGFSKVLEVRLSAVNDPKHPSLSQWRIELPQKGVPVQRLRCLVTSTLFDREMRLFEVRQRPGVGEEKWNLGRSRWTRTPDRAGGRYELTLDSVPSEATLWLETDNGDNGPLAIQTIQMFVPSVQLLFQAKDAKPMELYYGHPDMSRPRYDLALIAPRVLAAPKQEAGTSEANPQPISGTTSLKASPWIFYAVLAAVVAGLLFVIARLLPGPNPGRPA